MLGAGTQLRSPARPGQGLPSLGTLSGRRQRPERATGGEGLSVLPPRRFAAALRGQGVRAGVPGAHRRAEVLRALPTTTAQPRGAGPGQVWSRGI